MATWEDGPEYAPIERPVDFGRPSVAPLDVAPATPQSAAHAPKDRPVFSDPAVPVAPLATLVPAVDDPRDPQLPFDVASSSITGDSAWGALHWSPPSGLAPDATSMPVAIPGAGPQVPTGAPIPAGTGPWGAPAAAAWPAPNQPLTLSAQQAPPAPGGYPAPGTPEWFSPGPPPAPGTPGQVRPQDVFTAATPGLCIVLVLGGVFLILSPVLLAVALALSSRVGVAKQAVRRVFVVAVSLLGFIAVVGALTNQTGFSDWWGLVGGWALALCWVVLGVTLLLVYRGLKTPDDVSPRRATWG